MATALADRNVKIMPDILALGGGATLDGVGATLMKFLAERVGHRRQARAGRRWNR